MLELSRATPRFSSPAARSTPSAGCLPQVNRAEFYREEFLKHQRCLERQREYYSAEAIHNVEHALLNILARLDTLCRHQNCDEVIGGLLRKFDRVTRLSAWDDHRAH